MIPEKQKEFARNFTGKSPGRYHLLYLTLIGIVGSPELRKEVQEKFGRADYLPDKMYPVREELEMVFYAVERGVPAERMGKMVPMTYVRSHPEVMKLLTKDNVLELFIQAWDSENEYSEKTVEIIDRGEDWALLRRKINPMPCEFFTGAIKGLFEILKVPCQCREIKCQWKDPGEEACIYKVTWE